ncbi:polyprenol monophosphomannose synthase [Zavarzinella formosa]|uniref:polyprenol monophosphomannose synthase n=1 Tax=Zavarzinella formosa TaxID=360055 RepID=UPI0002F7554F|nr:polyprenol monophosphomannose synthase [Zavarzinella formosa]
MQAGLPARVLISMATYNEAGNVRELIARIHEQVPYADILVVDDNSPDGTGKIVDELSEADPRVRCLHRSGKLGLGTAIIVAMKQAIAQNYDMMVNIDADFSHPPRYLPAMLEGMSRKDIMIGSRYIRGGGSENWPLSRQCMSLGVNLLVRSLFRLGIRDASGGYRCYRVSKLRRVNFARMISSGYSFQQEMLYRCKLAGATIGETPILFENRKHGTSKVNVGESVRSLSTIVYLGIRAMLGIERKIARRDQAALAASDCKGKG